MFKLSEDISRLHSSSLLRTQQAIDHHSAFLAEYLAIIADPLLFRHFLNPIALLMHCDLAHLAKDNLVIIIVVPVIANGALSILLSRPQCAILVYLLLYQFLLLLTILLLQLEIQGLKYFLASLVMVSLLSEFNVL